jgi:glucan phosphoethanolaminetransferase (alkaline phosphatase superfamily)
MKGDVEYQRLNDSLFPVRPLVLMFCYGVLLVMLGVWINERQMKQKKRGVFKKVKRILLIFIRYHMCFYLEIKLNNMPK